MSFPESFSPLKTIQKAALSRWKIETLTGLLGMRSLQHHQAETEKNIAAENRHVRKTAWGETEEQPAGNDMGNTILGDNVLHPTPIVINGQQGSGLGKVLAGAAVGAALLAVPVAGIAGYALHQLINKPTPTAPQLAPQPTSDDSLDIGLGRFSDLLPKTP
jgi:hypothetical protein